MYEDVKEYYDKLGFKEWSRLDENAYQRIIFLLHMQFIKSHLFSGAKLLDAGCGAGRYSVEFAKAGCRVDLFDISQKQLRIAKEKIKEAGVQDNIDGITRGDICDLSGFEDESFDFVVCYGAPLSYVIGNENATVKEFYRVLKPGGMLFVSVNGKWGVFKMILGNETPGFFSDPKYWMIPEVIETGILKKHEKVNQPARHFFQAAELKDLLSTNGFHEITHGAAPCFCTGNKAQIEELSKDEKALETIIGIELATYTDPALLGMGEFLMAKGIKK